MGLAMDWVWDSSTMHWVWSGAVTGLGAATWWMGRQAGLEGAERWRERRIREELEAYARLDPSVTQAIHAGAEPMEAARLLAKRVCRTIAEQSAFTRVAMLLRDHEGKLICVGRMGTDDLTVAALLTWGEARVEEERSGKFPWLGAGLGAGPAGRHGGVKSFAIPLGEWGAFDREVGTWALSGRKERRRWRRAVVAAIRVGGGRMEGAIVVCADGERLHGAEAKTAMGGRALWTEAGRGGGLARAMGPIETLADRLASAMETEALTERVQKSEKLAGLGQLAGGVAHALNNPLTAVLGFAELIAETSLEPRVRKDAETIVNEALKMKETVQRLVDFWRPVTSGREVVDVAEMLRELAGACGDTLRARGVALVLSAGEGEGRGVRGSRDRLRQVFEHLLNNAAQAIAGARAREEGESHTIRLTVSQEERAVHVIVSDTGPGFAEPTRIFDPFYTTRGPEQGAGLGLSICYGIVREHGGEISAFNLHPHGAAVVVDLPAGTGVEGRVMVREKQPRGQRQPG
jgi:signal transduction histidine kinase